jgi:ABC-2 type transport system ATP-binding protein
VKALHEQGTSIFLTTHYLEEADALCDRVAIVDLGRIVALGTPAELKKQIAGDIVVINYDAPDGALAAEKLLDGNAVVLERHAIENGHQLYVDKGDEALPVILRILGQGGAAPRSVHLSRPSLDDVFLKLTGRSMRDTGEGEH